MARSQAGLMVTPEAVTLELTTTGLASRMLAFVLDAAIVSAALGR